MSDLPKEAAVAFHMLFDRSKWSDLAGDVKTIPVTDQTLSFFKFYFQKFASEASVVRFLRSLVAHAEQDGYFFSRGELKDLERQINEFASGIGLLKFAQSGQAAELGSALQFGAPVNFQDPRTGATALHYLAAFSARPALRVLLKHGKSDFLIQDKRGRLAWELASDADDPVIARLLLRKTAQQAREQGVAMPGRSAGAI